MYIAVARGLDALTVANDSIIFSIDVESCNFSICPVRTTGYSKPLLYRYLFVAQESDAVESWPFFSKLEYFLPTGIFFSTSLSIVITVIYVIHAILVGRIQRWQNRAIKATFKGYPGFYAITALGK